MRMLLVGEIDDMSYIVMLEPRKLNDVSCIVRRRGARRGAAIPDLGRATRRRSCARRAPAPRGPNGGTGRGDRRPAGSETAADRARDRRAARLRDGEPEPARGEPGQRWAPAARGASR